MTEAYIVHCLVKARERFTAERANLDGPEADPGRAGRAEQDGVLRKNDASEEAERSVPVLASTPRAVAIAAGDVPAVEPPGTGVGRGLDLDRQRIVPDQCEPVPRAPIGRGQYGDAAW